MLYTFSMIKPDATERNLDEKINDMIRSHDIEILLAEKITISTALAEKLYEDHKEKSFFKNMIKDITNGTVVIQILKGKNVIDRYRTLMGATDPKNAAEGTIRAKFSISIDQNSVHGSDSPESAKREISLMFPNFKFNL